MSLADVVSAVFFLLENSSLSGPFNFTAPNPVTNAQFTRALARRLHRPAIFPVPASILRIALGEIADEALLSGARVFPSKLSAAGFQFAHPTVDLALAAALAKR
jgi:NAD dependent epimerase/dehydratase family enzyme